MTMLKVEARTVAMFDGNVPVPTQMFYRPSEDPYAVQFLFQTPGGPDVEWVFGRELLIDGLKNAAGLGDVKIRPEFESVWIMLCSPDGSANFKFKRKEVQEFVNRMTSLCPRDTEHEFVNWDDELKMFED